jgi:hypothetical protein
MVHDTTLKRQLKEMLLKRYNKLMLTRAKVENTNKNRRKFETKYNNRY